MEKTVVRATSWALVSIYAAVIYMTLGVAPGVSDKINTLLGGRFDLLLYWIYLIAGGGILSYIVFVKRERSALKYLTLILFAGIFFMLLKFAHFSQEKIHMGEYGLMGIMVYNALKVDFDPFGNRLYFFGAMICIILSVVDEGIQWILPNRVFDWRDIFMGGVSSILALMVIKFNLLKEERKLENL